MSNLIVSVSPHLTHKDSTRTIMRDVLIALIPAVIASIVIFGWRALLLTIVCVGTAVFWEWAFQKICKRKTTIGDLSAAVTGLILAMNLPVGLPLWQAAFGTLVAIVVVKQLFGGIGYNFANPAITARVVMLIAFAGTMTTWAAPNFCFGADAVSAATPLAVLKEGGSYSLLNLFLGTVGGSMGETSALALLIGFVYLLCRKVISWHTPVAFIGSVFVLSLILGGDFMYAVNQVLAGGLVLGAVFMATDYATTPSTNNGRLIFGLGCGLLTVMICQWGSYAEGVSFAILFMNILTPYISKWTRTKPFGGVKA